MPDDSYCMVKLLARLSEKRQELEQLNAARQRLEQAAQSGGEIELEPLSNSAKLGAVKAQLHSVDENGMTIGPAQSAGEARPLVRNESLRLCMRVDDVLVCGDTSVIGRTQFEQDGETVYGYRLKLPAQLDQATAKKKDVVIDLPKTRTFTIEAELHCLKRQVPVRGMIAGLSEKLMQMRSRNAPSWLTEGDRMMLKTELPDGLGTIEQVVTVTSAQPTKDPDVTMICAQFVAPQHNLREWLDAGPIRWNES